MLCIEYDLINISGNYIYKMYASEYKTFFLILRINVCLKKGGGIQKDLNMLKLTH